MREHVSGFIDRDDYQGSGRRFNAILQIGRRRKTPFPLGVHSSTVATYLVRPGSRVLDSSSARTTLMGR